MKKCPKCNETKAFSEFYKNKRRKDGLQSHCKLCHRGTVTSYRVSNPDKILEAERKRYKTNRDKILGAKRKRYKDNPDKQREWSRAWQVANPERVKSYNHAYRARKVDLYGNEPDHARIAEWMELTANDPCRWCGTTEFPDGYHWDHVVPLSIGGPHEWWNVVKTCATCNLQKHARLPEAVGFI